MRCTLKKEVRVKVLRMHILCYMLVPSIAHGWRCFLLLRYCFLLILKRWNTKTAIVLFFDTAKLCSFKSATWQMYMLTSPREKEKKKGRERTSRRTRYTPKSQTQERNIKRKGDVNGDGNGDM